VGSARTWAISDRISWYICRDHWYLGHLERGIAAMADDLRTYLESFP
jgi:hypothetical protein